ncbi:MAG TPA: triacylglycerol lipase [Gemmatimonadaceae bacterium]|nr:triacylglycerol lipase [Gemmatimonadaceae bacterium]
MGHHKYGNLVIITTLAALSALVPGCAKKSVTEPDILCGVSRSDLSGSVTHNPILFVHGYGGANENFCTMIDRFRADGWKENELYAYDYSFVASFATDADEIRSQIDAIISRSGAQKVDIIAHSAGAVSSRYYIKHFGDSRVDAWVSLAGPNHGTDTADNCSFTPCLEIRLGSTFLADLNSGDETPGAVRYATWWSPCDETINPDTSVLLTGATNNQTSCLAHFNLLVDQLVYQQVRDFVR